MTNIVYLHLGSNLGNKKENLDAAILAIHQEIGEISLVSNIYQTEAWGNTNQDDFLNLALKLETNCNANELLKTTKQIETKMGRVKEIKWGPRIIDIDILFFNNDVIETNQLTIPHPHIEKRNFVIYPLAEIAPDFKHPILNITIEALKQNTIDACKLELLEDE